MASKTNFIIDQGSTVSLTTSILDANNELMVFSGYSGRSKFKKHYASTNSYILGVALSNGSVTLTMNSSATAIVPAGRYVYDVEILDGSNNVTRILEGIITVTPRVTS